MNKENKKNVYKLFRELSDVLGIAEMTILCLNSFIESIRQLKSNRENLDSLYLELAETIKHSQPHIVPLMHLLEQFEEDMEKELKPEMSMEKVGHIAISSLQDKIAQFKNNAEQVTQKGLDYINNGDVIVVHSASTVVTTILVRAKEELGKQFSVIILDHNPVRTRQTVQVMRDADIEYIVAPAHNLSHYINKATKMFFGAMTITSDRQIVSLTGTSGTVSLCHYNSVPVHLFANTLHYSHKKALDQDIYTDKKDAHGAHIDFSITTHSHDLVSLDMIDHIITEHGETQKAV